MSRKVPEGWSEGAFDRFITLQRGFDLPVQDRLPGDIPVYASNGVIGYHCEARISGPSVVTGRSGTLGKVFYYPDGCWPLNTTLYVKDFHGNDPSFVHRFLEHFNLGRFGTGTSVPTLNRNIVHKESIVFPALPEQRRIADILSSVDEAIQATQAVIEQTRKVKQGVLNRLLTKGIGHTRFKQTEIGEIPEAWACLEVARITANMDSGWSPDCEADPAGENEWGVLKTSAVVWEGYRAWENKRLPTKLQPRPEIEVKAGDVLITRAGPVDRTGVVAFVDQTPPKRMLSDKIIRIQTKSDICLPEFLSLALSSPTVQLELIRRKSGMALSQTNISQKTLKATSVPVPSLREQKEIVGAVRSIADAFKAAEDELKSLIVAKAALMSDLLTGRKRVFTDLPMAAE